MANVRIVVAKSIRNFIAMIGTQALLLTPSGWLPLPSFLLYQKG
jgi:hypothetical protein